MSADPSNISLRPELPEDFEFLRAVFDSTRVDELAAAGLPTAIWPSFLQMQFKAQREGYRATFPLAHYSIIVVENIEVGRMVVDRSGPVWILVDIAVLPEHRGQGIGSALLQQLQREAEEAKHPIRLSVMKSSRAAHLYERLGFSRTGEEGPRDHMEWHPKSSTVSG